MKKSLLAIGIFISLTTNAQKKDSVVILNDSINTISILDIQKVLTSMEDKVSKKEWDIWLRAFQTLAQQTEDKRKKVVPKK